jgi:hypothetical protein
LISSGILIVRMYAVWDKSKIVLTVLLVLALSIVTSSAYVAVLWMGSVECKGA